MDGVSVSNKRNQTISIGDLYNWPTADPGLGAQHDTKFSKYT